jgi:pantetheine-phosphate adenylyltransferase
MRKIIYPGTFDPIHNGHIDIAKRASKLFDEVEFVLAINGKKKPLFSVEERLEMIRDSVKEDRNIKVSYFEGLVVDHAKAVKANSIIRGMRHVSDFEYEFQMAMMNFHLDPNITSLFMMPDEKYIHLNSTLIKDVIKNRGDVTKFVPKFVHDQLLSKFSE